MSRMMIVALAVLFGTAVQAVEDTEMRHLFKEGETITSRYDFEIVRHPYLSDGATVAKGKAGETVGPLAPGNYLVTETLAPGRHRTRYLGVAGGGWTVLQFTVGTFTADAFDSVFHACRIPVNYYVGFGQAMGDSTFLGYERDYGDDIWLHFQPNGMSGIDPKFRTLKENWEEFTKDEIVERLRAIDAKMQAFGYRPLRGFASYTPANSLIAAMRDVNWCVLHSIIPEQNWSDGHWAINHWGMPNQPFYFAGDDFRKAVGRGEFGAGRDVLGMGMNSYHLYMPHVVHWGDNVCSPSHFLRWNRTVESGENPVRYRNFLIDYLRAADGLVDKSEPFFLFSGHEFGRSFGTRSMTVHNRKGAQLAIDLARTQKIVFANGTDVAKYYAVHHASAPEVVFTQRDYLAGTRIMDKPVDSGPSIGMEMKLYKACFDHLSPLPYYHYDYTIPWHFKAADQDAPSDFALEDREKVKVKCEGEKVVIEVKEPLARITPVAVWDADLADVPAGLRVFHPAVLDDGRFHTVVELPKGFKGTFVARRIAKSAPDKAEFGGLTTPLWRVQTIGTGDNRQAYAFLDCPILEPVEIDFTCPRACRIDALEAPMGEFKKGDKVKLVFDTRRPFFRFWGLDAKEIQPDAEAVAKIERCAADWKAFSENAPAELARIHAADDAFVRSIVPADEEVLLDVDCFGNAVFGERSRALAFDRVVKRTAKLIAHEYSDGGMSFGKGRSYWVHPRMLHTRIEGIDSLGLKPDDELTVRLISTTPSSAVQPHVYRVEVRAGWDTICPETAKIRWRCPKERGPDAVCAIKVRVGDARDGMVTVRLPCDQKGNLDDWFVDQGYISALERIVITKPASKDVAEDVPSAATVKPRDPTKIWDRTTLYKTPKSWKFAGEFDSEVTPIMLEGEPYQGRPTTIFAYYGVPKTATKENPAPAIVLAHGGLGTAYPEWVRLWVRRGYAAISVDTCGALPVIDPVKGGWVANPSGGPRGWGRVDAVNDPERDQWMYHAVAAVIRSHSFLRSLPNVDTRAVGLTGVSWGGILTCVAAAADDRFAYAAPVYGCGFTFEPLGQTCFDAANKTRNSRANVARWAQLWDPIAFLPFVKCPFLWVDGTNDFTFSLDAVRRSAALAPVEHAFSTRLRMRHCHGPVSEAPAEILAFADHFTRGEKDLVRVGEGAVKDGVLTVPFDAKGRKVVRAELLTTVDGKNTAFPKRQWNAMLVDGFDPSRGEVSVKLPGGTLAWFVNLITDDGLIFSSPYAQIPIETLTPTATTLMGTDPASNPMFECLN